MIDKANELPTPPSFDTLSTSQPSTSNDKGKNANDDKKEKKIPKWLLKGLSEFRFISHFNYNTNIS